MMPLNGRELFVLQRMALGDGAARVAHLLGEQDHVNRVRFSARSAIAKLGARNITHAAVLALDAGLIHPQECGTERTYRWHLRHGEEPDQRCRQALADVRRGQRQGEKT